MTIVIKKKGQDTLIEVGGVLDKFTAGALENAINDSAKGTKSIVLDLNGIEHISYEGLHTILGARKRMNEIGSLRLTGVCESVMQVLEGQP
jgi:anti-anti-sigma factor